MFVPVVALDWRFSVKSSLAKLFMVFFFAMGIIQYGTKITCLKYYILHDETDELSVDCQVVMNKFVHDMKFIV